MSERTARAVVNDLIETCRDGERGLQNAAALIKDGALETMLLDLAAERSGFAAALEPHAQRLGGDAAAQGTAAAALHRGWMDLKSVLTSHDDQAVMAEVVRGDALTLRVFADAISGILPPSIRDVVEEQERRLRAGHARIADAVQTSRVRTP